MGTHLAININLEHIYLVMKFKWEDIWQLKITSEHIWQWKQDVACYVVLRIPPLVHLYIYQHSLPENAVKTWKILKSHGKQEVDVQ